MQKFPPGTILNNRYKIHSVFKFEGESIIYRVEDIRFTGSYWILHQIDLLDKAKSKAYLSNLFSFLSFLSKIVYDKIGKIVDYFTEDNYLIVICEEIIGTLFTQIIYSSNSNITKAIKLALQLLDIVKFLYEKNIINFVDLNPENIIIDKQGMVRITNFAIDKIITLITEDGVLSDSPVGTLGYIPPEMLDDDKTNIGQHSYIYIICSIIYEYLTKMNPYLRGDPFFYPPLASVIPLVDPKLSSLIEKCLNYNPNNRIKTFKEFEKKLTEILKETNKEESYNTNPFLNTFGKLTQNRFSFIVIIVILIQFLIITILLIYYFLFLL